MTQLLNKWRYLCISRWGHHEEGPAADWNGQCCVCHTGQRVGLKLKSGLFRSLVMSVLLYNAECWPMCKNNTDAVEGFIYSCLSRVARLERGSPGALKDHPSRAEVVGVAASPHAEELLRESGFAGRDTASV